MYVVQQISELQDQRKESFTKIKHQENGIDALTKKLAISEQAGLSLQKELNDREETIRRLQPFEVTLHSFIF